MRIIHLMLPCMLVLRMIMLGKYMHRRDLCHIWLLRRTCVSGSGFAHSRCAWVCVLCSCFGFVYPTCSLFVCFCFAGSSFACFYLASDHPVSTDSRVKVITLESPASVAACASVASPNNNIINNYAVLPTNRNFAIKAQVNSVQIRSAHRSSLNLAAHRDTALR